MKRAIIVVVLFLIFISFMSLNAQWAITYGGSDDDYAHSIQQTNDGGYIIAGVTNSFGAGGDDIWILKLSSDGEIEWQKTYGRGRAEGIYSFQQTGDGGYIVLGRTSSFGAGGDDIWILKLSSDGEIEWQKTYGEIDWEGTHFFQQTDDGGYIVAGHNLSFGAGSNDTWVLKLATNGEIEWQKTYGGGRAEGIYSFQQTGDGGYIVAGWTGSFGAGEDDIWILKLSPAGDIEWQKTYGGTLWEKAHSIQQTDDGGYIVAGWTSSFGTDVINSFVLKLSSDGEIEWQKTYWEIDWEGAHFFQQTDDGGYIVLGRTVSFYLFDIWVFKLFADGEIEWQKTYGGNEGEYAHSIQQTDDGGYIVLGRTVSLYLFDIWMLKLSSNGNIEWQKTYGSNYSWDYAHSIQETMDGGYIVAGETNSWGDGGEIWVLKLLANGDINPRCVFIKSSSAEVSDTDNISIDSDMIPEDANIISEDTNIIPQDTGISPLDSEANVYKLCVSDILTLTLSADSGGTTDPEPGTYTYDTGIEVTLEAIRDSEYNFSGWSGNVKTNINPITLTMDGDKTISAKFYKTSPGGGDSDEWGGGGGGGYEGGCFIATAAYGTPLHPHVETLRNFRDRYLMPSKIGCEFVDLYYKYSPFVANIIAKHKSLRVIVQINLTPFVVFSYSMVYLGPIVTGVILIFVFMLPFFLVMSNRRKFRQDR